MSENSKIQWTHHTGGPWLGCTEKSPGCAECYARDLAEARLEHIFRAAYKRAGFDDWETRPVWGNKAPRVLTKGFWTEAFLLNARAEKAGERYRMFPSMIDWLDDMPAGIIDQAGNWRDRSEVLAMFLHVVRATTNLDWLLLTKRPENWLERIDAARILIGQSSAEDDPEFEWIENWLVDKKAPSNVWLGVSVEDQKRADERIPILLETPAAIRFLSCEPLLEHVSLIDVHDELAINALEDSPHVDWVIVGGESGPYARACELRWVDSIVHDCKSADVPVFVKQLGAKPMCAGGIQLPLRDRKGGDPDEWPADLRVREFPETRKAIAA